MQTLLPPLPSPAPAKDCLWADGRAPRRIGVFRALQLGDLLCAVPALRALRQAYPQARITLIGLPWAAGFAQRFARYVDDFLAFPGGEGLPEATPAPGELERFYAQARGRRFDAVLQLHGSGEQSNAVVARLGARVSGGFCHSRQACPDPARYTRYPAHLPEVQRPLALLRFLGVRAADAALEFPLQEGERAAAEALRARLDPQGRGLAIVHPGARAPARRWGVAGFAQVGRALTARGLRVAITGSAAERALTASLAAAIPGSVDLAGQTELGVLGALLAKGRLLVCNDTGVSHLAAALATPSVVVFTASLPARWAPADRVRHRAVWQPVACRPCAYRFCPIEHPCARDLAPERVVHEALALLAGTEAA